jgi:hypothetical protein
LDDKRLGKQRVEAFQIINILTGKRQGWKNHPAVLMWTGCVTALQLYCNAMIREWIARGKNNNMVLYDVAVPTAISSGQEDPAPDNANIANIPMPWWMGWQPFHDSHRASLLRKDPAFYGPKLTLANSLHANYGYIWPSKLRDADGELVTHETAMVRYKLSAEPVNPEDVCEPLVPNAVAGKKRGRATSG